MLGFEIKSCADNFLFKLHGICKASLVTRAHMNIFSVMTPLVPRNIGGVNFFLSFL